MTRQTHFYCFTCLLVTSAFVYTSRTYADTSGEFLHSDNETDRLKDDDLISEATLQETCTSTNPCQNGGLCYEGVCTCPTDYSSSLCEMPTWCIWGRCGFQDDVECIWDRVQQKGECRCKKENYHYLTKKRKCYACNCGDYGECKEVDDLLACKCLDKYALKSQKCEPCDCGPRSLRCFFSSSGEKMCLCPKGYSSKTTRWSLYKTWCEICDCGEHGKCSWEREEKICDCEAGYRSFEGKCIECDCGKDGTCRLDESGDKVCTCDYGFAEKEGRCQICDCNYVVSKRFLGVNCTFVDGLKSCICPPGFETGSEFCQDINECYTSRPCPVNSLCFNKPGTFECKCEPGYKPIRSSLNLKLSGCEDIDECVQSPCTSPTTRCVNSPGSYDCVCADGYYATSSTYGSAYNPSFNACYETETQWREATIALGVILSVGIIGISCYIMKHKSSS